MISNQSSVTSTLALSATESSNNVTPLPELRQSSEPKCFSNLMTPDDFSSSNEKTETDGAQKSPLLPPVSMLNATQQMLINIIFILIILHFKRSRYSFLSVF